jgi:hypothetical protein
MWSRLGHALLLRSLKGNFNCGFFDDFCSFLSWNVFFSLHFLDCGSFNHWSFFDDWGGFNYWNFSTTEFQRGFLDWRNILTELQQLLLQLELQ